MQVQTHVDIHSEWGIVAARQAGRKLAREIGFGSVDQARVTTAISELARNIYLYANKGQIYIEEVTSSGKRGIKIIAADEGPGIKDIRRVMEDGYTTSGGLGAGLPGVKRLMDEFKIDSELDEGTTISAIKWLR
ncbi:MULTISPECIES: anti-sigma regulatory factor [Alteribacter]|uniref:Anti-sigma regulatory factor n=1 Tax=Alteribacter keqinensis TaxID=2483800 RepID=A0A3M7TME5_9BACI|nr:MULTISPECIES: anti-sigma regulatory factor [Alteribacter]MBM7096817.1 anti-sigma regulatory factor [Alteribacter salitolerans]RNA66350.1 anti-sigma regulatory factor [Alteribacter keqinensis]